MSTPIGASTSSINKFSGTFNLNTLPPFPDDVETAPLLRVSLEKLLVRDTDEVDRFTRACKDIGFFYLDLTTSEVNANFMGARLLKEAEELFLVGERFYELPLEEKQKYDFTHQNSYFGYKGYGANIVDTKGNLDRNEFYNVSKDDIFEISGRLPAPDVLEPHRSLIKSFMTSAHSVVDLVLELLNEYLNLPPGTLPRMHRLEASSGDQVRFVKAPPQPMDDRRVALGEHTDFGSVTVLFNRLGGLQVLPPGKGAKWCYVKPLANHAIINLGDAMVKFTNGLLRSNIHRVVSPPGQQAKSTRHSLVYFARPEDHILMKRLEGSNLIPKLTEGQEDEEINSKDWIIRRALGSRHALKGTGNFDFSRAMGTEAMSKRDGG